MDACKHIDDYVFSKARKLKITLAQKRLQGNQLPPLVSEDHPGHFEGQLGTLGPSDHFHFVQYLTLLFPHHRVHVQTSLDFHMDMMRADSTHKPLRRKHVVAVVPVLMFRLGRVQDAYNFVKWCATHVGNIEDDRWNNGRWETKLPKGILDTNHTMAADVLEEPSWWMEDPLKLGHAPLVMLIKIRVLLELRDLQNTMRAFEASSLPREIVDLVCGQLLGDSPLAGRRDVIIADTATLSAMIERVRKQVWALYLAVDEETEDLWPLLVNWTEFGGRLQMPESLNGRGQTSKKAVWMALLNYVAWEQTPGSLDAIEALFLLHTVPKTDVKDSYQILLGQFLMFKKLMRSLYIRSYYY